MGMLRISPGVAFLATHASRLALPVGVTYFAVLRLGIYFDFVPLSFPAFLAAGALLTLPAIAVKRHWRDFLNRRMAAARGEVLPPAIRDPWPFNFGFLFRMIEAFQTGYVGTHTCRDVLTSVCLIPMIAEVPLAVSRELGQIFSAQTGFGPLVSSSAVHAALLYNHPTSNTSRWNQATLRFVHHSVLCRSCP
jgi:hypothetical protein